MLSPPDRTVIVDVMHESQFYSTFPHLQETHQVREVLLRNCKVII